MLFSLIIGFVLGAAAIVFAIQNTAIVALTFLGWQFQSSLALIVVVMVIGGFLLGLALSVPSIIRRSFAIGRLTKQNKGLHDEAETLRKENHDLTVRLQAQANPTPETIDLRQ